MTALQRRHTLMATLLDKGLARRDGKKTSACRASRTPPHLQDDWRITLLLPERYLVAPGATAIGGVTVEPDPFSGPLVVVTAKGLEWCLRQLGRFLIDVANDERIMTAVVTRGATTYEQQVCVIPGSVEFPQRKGFPTIKVER